MTYMIENANDQTKSLDLWSTDDYTHRERRQILWVELLIETVSPVHHCLIPIHYPNIPITLQLIALSNTAIDIAIQTLCEGLRKHILVQKVTLLKCSCIVTCSLLEQEQKSIPYNCVHLQQGVISIQLLLDFQSNIGMK